MSGMVIHFTHTQAVRHGHCSIPVSPESGLKGVVRVSSLKPVSLLYICQCGNLSHGWQRGSSEQFKYFSTSVIAQPPQAMDNASRRTRKLHYHPSLPSSLFLFFSLAHLFLTSFPLLSSPISPSMTMCWPNSLRASFLSWQLLNSVVTIGEHFLKTPPLSIYTTTQHLGSLISFT